MTRYAPLWQQAGSYPSQLDRYLLGALWPSGGLLGGALSAVANTMNVSIAPGSVGVPMQAGQGSSLCHWDAAELVTIDPAPPTGQTRLDVIVALVRDAAVDGGPNNDWLFTVIKGTPGASWTRPALPPNAFSMGELAVPGGAANLNGVAITQTRAGGLAVPAPAAYDLQAGGAWISTDAASAAFINFPRPFAGKPQYFSANAGQGTVNGVTFSANGNGDATRLQLTGWNAAGVPFQSGAVFFVQWLAIYIPGQPSGAMTREEFLEKERQEQ